MDLSCWPLGNVPLSILAILLIVWPWAIHNLHAVRPLLYMCYIIIISFTVSKQSIIRMPFYGCIQSLEDLLFNFNVDDSRLNNQW